MERSLFLVALLALVAPSLADTLAFNATLASPNDPPKPGWYFDANPQDGFTVDTGGTTRGTNPPGPIETGLRARQGTTNGGVINSPTDIYNVAAGNAWSFDFSVDLRPNDTFSLTFNSVSVSMTITDITTLASVTLDPTTFWTDQAGWNNANNMKSAFYKNGVEQKSDWGMQDSKSLSGLLPAYDVHALDDYTITLSVNEGMTLLSTDTIQVDTLPATAPLPGPMFASSALLALLGLAQWMKRGSTPALNGGAQNYWGI